MIQPSGGAGHQSLIAHEPVSDDEALIRNLELAELLAMLAAAQFDDRDQPFELAFELDITL